MSGVRSSSTRRRSSAAFLSLPAKLRAGRKSATAAAISSTSARSNAAAQASCSCGGGLDVDVAHARVARQRDVRGDDRHVGAERGRLLGEREAHPPRRAVADEAHGVDRLARAAGGDEHAQAREVRLGRRRAPGTSASIAASRSAGSGSRPGPASPCGRQAPAAGLEHGRAARAQRRDVRLRRGVLPHLVVHRRARRAAGSVGGERGARQEVVGEPGGELGDRVRRGRRDREDVGVADELEVAERVVVGQRLAGERAARRVALELVDEDRRAGQRGERGGADEARARRRLDDAHGVPGGGRQADELQRLVGGDPTTDAEQDPGHGGPSPAA